MIEYISKVGRCTVELVIYFAVRTKIVHKTLPRTWSVKWACQSLVQGSLQSRLISHVSLSRQSGHRNDGRQAVRIRDGYGNSMRQKAGIRSLQIENRAACPKR